MSVRGEERDSSGRFDEGKDKKPAATQTEDDACRCKETAAMTPGELLRRMMSDLAFWKKEPKD